MQSGLTDARVLIVEDEALIALMLEDMLEEAGWRIAGIACTIGAALPLARTAPLDVALLDINICGERVDPVIEVLRGRNIPVLLITGYDPGDLGFRYAAFPILHKPVRPDHLLAALGRCLRVAA